MGGLSNFQLTIGDALTVLEERAQEVAHGAVNRAGPPAWRDDRIVPGARAKPFVNAPNTRAYWERRLLGATLKHTVSHSSRGHPRFWFAGHQEILIELQPDHGFEWNELTHADTLEQTHMLEPHRTRRYGSWSVEGQPYAAQLVLHVLSDDKLLRGQLDAVANDSVVIDQRRYEIY